jgi:hypothetical protein
MDDSQSPKRSRKKRETSSESNEREAESFSPTEDSARLKLLEELRRSTLSLVSKLQPVSSSVMVSKSVQKRKEIDSPRKKNPAGVSDLSSGEDSQKRKSKKKKSKKEKKRRRSSSDMSEKIIRHRSGSSERKKEKKSKRKITLENGPLEVQRLLQESEQDRVTVICLSIQNLYKSNSEYKNLCLLVSII